MVAENFPISNENGQEQLLLKAKLKALQNELAVVLQKTTAFEITLRSHLENEIIEEQELTVLYKKFQQEKKQKRLAQKQKGKKYKQPIGLKTISKNKEVFITVEDQKERKRLYREAMLFSHPDKFSMDEDKVDLATEITSKLIEIYKNESLETLQNYHSHICSGNAFLQPISFSSNIVKDIYLEKEIEQVEDQLNKAKNKHTYKVLTEYENPLSFITELKEFYADRIFKLKKRTRKARL